MWRRLAVCGATIGTLAFLAEPVASGPDTGPPTSRRERRVSIDEEMVSVPAGEFTMGTSEASAGALARDFRIPRSWFAREQPSRQVWVATFLTDKYEVTNEAYQRFVIDTGRRAPKDWTGTTFLPNRERHPVVNVNREDAEAYCRWAGKRLPTEQEWEKAARGPGGRSFPWGEEPDAGRANTVETGRWDTAPVGSFPLDVSPYGAMDMGGNVTEWVADDYRLHLGGAGRQTGLESPAIAVGRGGNWRTPMLYARASNRIPAHSHGHPEQGFRCAADPESIRGLD